jgi:hypothetical protein
MDDYSDDPGICDPREFTRRALEDYSVFLLAHVEVWRVRHERLGVSAPFARSLEAEACITSFGLFREFYEGHAFYVLPFCLTLPCEMRCN